MIITSSSNDRVKQIKKLQKSARERRKSGMYIVEGIRMFEEIPDEDLVSVYFSESFLEKNRELAEHYGESIVVADKVFAEMSDTDTPQGVLALVRLRQQNLEAVLGDGAQEPLILIVEALQDPGNLGTIIRSAEGAGVTGVVVSKDSVDAYNPKTIRATMGAIFRVPVYTSDNLKSDIDILKKKNVTVYAAHLAGREFYELDMKKGCAFLIGNEGNGLSDEISDCADGLLKIPMCGRLESLNAATSASLIAYEALRQRRI